MVEQSVQTQEAPPLELFRASSRLWLRNDTVACGLLTDEHAGPAGPRYWKWNRRLGHCRVTSVFGDKKLFPDSSAAQGFGIDPANVLSYKPESRLAWREFVEPRALFCKVYRKTSFQRAAEGAGWFKALAATPPLHEIDSDRRVIRWRWINGGPPPTTATVQVPLALASPLHEVAHTAESGLPRLTPDRIRGHMHDRLEAFNAWLPILFPSRLETFRPLAEELIVLDRRLAALATPRRLKVIHGDLRRRNVMIDYHGKPRLLDSDHVVLGEREWDLAAWIADDSMCSDDPCREACDALAKEVNLDVRRLDLYTRVWRLLIALKSIEEQTG